MSSKNCNGVFLAKFIAGCFKLGKKMRPVLFQKHYALYDSVLVCI